MEDGSEPILDDEILYRRVPTLWYSPETGLDPEAFHPHKTEDHTGLSLSRAKYKTPSEAARSPRPGKSYYVAVLKASDMRRHGIRVDPRPRPGDPGHSELPDLNSGSRRESLTLERQRILVTLCLRVEGPFPSGEETTGR